jgi:hypothetical protein
MFGRDWERVKAKVVAAREMENKPVYTSHGGGTLRRRYEYVLDVEPPGGRPAFRTSVLSPMNVDKMPTLRVGQVVFVQCHPKAEKVKFDTDEPTTRRNPAEIEKKEQAAFDAVRDAPPGTRPPGVESEHYVQPTPEQMRANREEHEARMQGRRTGGTKPGDRLQRLEKLGDLHDRGVLNDAEFAAEKAKILAEGDAS